MSKKWIVGVCKYSNTFDATHTRVNKTACKLLLTANRARLKSHINYLQQCFIDRVKELDADDLNVVINEEIEHLRSFMKDILQGTRVTLKPKAIQTVQDGKPGRFFTISTTILDTMTEREEKFDMVFKLAISRA